MLKPAQTFVGRAVELEFLDDALDGLRRERAPQVVELEVARLIVDRRTNAQIAAELFLSTKTVETHIRNLFRKLGVSSRVEMARTIERSDRGAPAAPW